MGNFFSSLGPVSFSGRVLLHGVCTLLYLYYVIIVLVWPVLPAVVVAPLNKSMNAFPIYSVFLTVFISDLHAWPFLPSSCLMELVNQ